jgi:branched-chain amino acid transport system ATP-binding protein
MLTIEGLKAGYGQSQALAGIDLEVPPGTLVAILGRNGMGKTSLCRSIMSLAPPNVWQGSIAYDGAELTALQPHEVARQGLGYVPQGRHVFPTLTVVDNLTVAARVPVGGGAPAWDLDRVWEMFPRLQERRTNEAGQLSGGEQQMLAIARALMTNPSLLIMDEPSEGLAPTVVETLIQTIKDLAAAGMGLLVVEQNLGVATTLAERLLVMVAGSIAAETTASELLADPEAQKRYLGVEPLPDAA